jgi:UDP-N-acetyl-D-glucosamine/UDP-N-acetyl-D-galactosamine dehydrogenase
MSAVDLSRVRIAVLGLGYVGLPLALCAARHFPVVGFDVNRTRIEELQEFRDRTGEVSLDEFHQAKKLRLTADPQSLSDSNFFIVTVPTPIDRALQPDLTAIRRATETVGNLLKPGAIVVYESTVYPGVTEEVCVPILENASGLTLNEDFFVGYSPERINPGDRHRRLTDIRKITSGSTPQAADFIDRVYASFVKAGTHKASSIRVAEAAKVIENIQRDVNIALINELAQLFKRLGIDSSEVLAAAGTKWNFHSYSPGLVGGHCIGVDPYYLTHKAQSIGFHPEMILAGRRINDSMGGWIAGDIVRTMLKRRLRLDTARVLIMGFTFKENCPDVRNTKVADLVRELADVVKHVDIYDPLADPEEVQSAYGVPLLDRLPLGPYEAVVLAVCHEKIAALGAPRIRELCSANGIIYDVKSVLPPTESDARL